MRYRSLCWILSCMAAVACNGSIDLGSEGDASDGADGGAIASPDSGSQPTAQDKVGSLCVPVWEMCPSESGTEEWRARFDYDNPMCNGGTCLANHFRGRVTCPFGNPAGNSLFTGTNSGMGKECLVPGTLVEVGAAVPPQCRDRKDNVYCTCQCDGEATDRPYCTCPEGFVCGIPTGVLEPGLLAPGEKYCVREGNDSSQDGTTCCSLDNPACPDRCDTADQCGYSDNLPEIASQVPSSLRCEE